MQNLTFHLQSLAPVFNKKFEKNSIETINYLLWEILDTMDKMKDEDLIEVLKHNFKKGNKNLLEYLVLYQDTFFERIHYDVEVQKLLQKVA